MGDHGLRSLPRVIGVGLIWLLVASDLFIVYIVFGSSFKTTEQIFASPWAPPTSLSLSNWVRAWGDSGFGTAAVVTVALTISASVMVVAISAPAAYILSRIPGRTSSILTVGFALGLGIPSQVIVIPIFVMLSHFGLTNSLPGLLLVYIGLGVPFTVFLLTGFFRALPSEIEEAAALDGLSPAMSFWRIMLPISRAGLVTALALNAISVWNEGFISLVFLQSPQKYTLSVALLNLLGTLQSTGADYGAVFAGVCILVLPMLAIYVWLGGRIIEGMTMGSGR